MNEPNMQLSVEIGEAGLGKVRVEDLSPQVTTELSVSDPAADVAIGQVDDSGGETATYIFVSGAKADSQVTVSYYTPGE